MTTIVKVEDKNEIMMTTKRKRVSLTLKEKVVILKRVDRGESVLKLAAEYGIGRQTIRDLMKKKHRIFEFMLTPAATSDRKSMKVTSLINLDAKIFEWYQNETAKGREIKGADLCQKALWFHKELKITKPFSASQGWLFRFKLRHGLLGRQLENKNESDPLDASIDDTDENEIETVKIKQEIFEAIGTEDSEMEQTVDEDFSSEGFIPLVQLTDEEPYEEEENQEVSRRIISANEAMAAMGVLKTFCQQRNFDVHNIMNLKYIQKKIKKVMRKEQFM